MFRFPWTNEHELNLDWLIRRVKALEEKKSEGVVTSVNGSTGDVVLPIPLAFNGTPAALGTAAAGSSDTYARGDHVHQAPTPAEIGAATAEEVSSLQTEYGHYQTQIDDLAESMLIDKETWTNPSTYNTTNRYFGAHFPKKTYVYSIKPSWNNATPGKATVRLYKMNGDFVVGTEVTEVDSWTINIGDTIILNRIFDVDDLIVIHGNANTLLRYSGPSAQWTLDVEICRLNSARTSIDQKPNGHYAGKYVLNILSDPLPGNTLMAIGDSMVYGHTIGVDKSWPAIVGKMNDMQVDNRGTNGAYMSNVQYNGHDNSVYQKTCVSGSEFYISDSDLQASKYIIVYAGTNDCNHSTTIGTIDSVDPSTFCGALNLICQSLQTRAPASKIAFITPYLRAGIESRCETYITAIKNVCRKYSIPVFDNGADGGICWSNQSIRDTLTIGGSDTFHLNEAGMVYVSTKYSSFLKTL